MEINPMGLARYNYFKLNWLRFQIRLDTICLYKSQLSHFP